MLVLALLALAGPYRWRSVPMVGAGFVDGIVFHPKVRDVRFARTDIGGAYRWERGRWVPMLDWVGYDDLNLMGVESLAVDPNDARKVYLACGTYTNPTTPDGAILRSGDGGRTFAVARPGLKFGGNENGRGNGERLSVDPFEGRHLLLGTRHDGLWQSDDGAASWRRVVGLSAQGGAGGAGIVVTLFDPKTKGTAYAAVSDASGPTLYRTTDGGVSWAEVPGAPRGLYPTHLVRGEDGALWITYGSNPGPQSMNAGAVWRYADGRWTDVTPERGVFGYAAVTSVKGVTLVSSFYRPGGEQIFRTRDEGKTWRTCIGGKETYDYRGAPYTSRVGIHWLFDLEIDPFDPNHALFTTGYGGHETFDLGNADRGRPVHWRTMAKGIEESVVLALLSPTKGVPLVSAIGDYGGFVHRDLERPAPEGNFTNPHFGNTTDVAAGDLSPETIVRVGRASGAGREANLGFSNDGGRTWQPPASVPPGAREGSIAVSADGTAWIWSVREGAFRTDDAGKSWTSCEGLPAGLCVVADRIARDRFYAVDLFQGRLYVSDDGGRRFLARGLGFTVPPGDRGDARGGQDRLYTTPGRVGDLWIAAYDGLYHTTLSKPTFVKLPGVETIHAFGFGKAAARSDVPAIYLVGTIGGRHGFYRSDDGAGRWEKIDDPDHQWGLVLQVTGDPKKYGRVFLGTHGRGAFTGDLNP